MIYDFFKNVSYLELEFKWVAAAASHGLCQAQTAAVAVPELQNRYYPMFTLSTRLVGLRTAQTPSKRLRPERRPGQPGRASPVPGRSVCLDASMGAPARSYCTVVLQYHGYCAYTGTRVYSTVYDDYDILYIYI